jgi:hypothetical protein
MSIMPLRLVPYPHQCIWCLRYESSATFGSESHVLPRCIGNIAEQVLPKGVVCDDCNHHFGRELERSLIEEPILRALAAILGLRDGASEFSYQHAASGVRRTAHITAEVSANRITVTTQYEIEGQPNKPSEARAIVMSKDYVQRDLAFLSRAVHKIAFESVAHSLFVGTGLKKQSKEMGDIDLFDHGFNVIREWVRYGEPQHSVRPALRILKLDEVKRQEELWEWGGKGGRFQGWIYYELNLFNDWYIVSLTSPASKVRGHLVDWFKKRKPKHRVWTVGDRLQTVD